MEYRALIMSLPDSLHILIKKKLGAQGIDVMMALDMRDAARLLARQSFQIIVVYLDNLRQDELHNFLSGIRCATFAPLVVVSNEYNENAAESLLAYGVDMCLPAALSPCVLVGHCLAQFRRYTAYNHFDEPEGAEVAPFQCGDIYIDPLRRIVRVLDRPVELWPREFSLLLYFLRNPQIVLTADQIGAHIGMEYSQSVGQLIYELRQSIEPNPNNPAYIETVHRVGYRFTAHSSESCGRNKSVPKSF